MRSSKSHGSVSDRDESYTATAPSVLVASNRASLKSAPHSTQGESTMENGSDGSDMPKNSAEGMSKTQRRSKTNQLDHQKRKVDFDQISARLTRSDAAPIDLFCLTLNLTRAEVMRALIMGLVDSLDRNKDLVGNLLTAYVTGNTKEDQKKVKLRKFICQAIDQVNSSLKAAQAHKTKSPSDLSTPEFDSTFDEAAIAEMLDFQPSEREA